MTVSSPSLQGTRTTVTDINGNYVVRGLPPGEYSVTTELSGHAAEDREDDRRARPDHVGCDRDGAGRGRRVR